MSEFFFQILLAALSIVVGISVPLLPTEQQKSIARWFSLATIAIALIWAGYEWGARQSSSSPQANTGLTFSLPSTETPYIPLPTLTPMVIQSVSATQSPTVTPQPILSQYSSSTFSPVAQEVQWIPDNDGMGTAGLCLDEWYQTLEGPICPNNDNFVSWNLLQKELQQVLPLVPNIPSGSALRLKNGSNGELNWIIQIIDPYGNEIANVWIGNDPLNSWKYDGLIRIGYPYTPVKVWATLVRYSDNSYRRKE